MDKYINLKDELVHCPFCRGVILKDFKIDPDTKDISFVLRCPHCKNNIIIKIYKDKLVVEEPSEDLPQ